MSSDDVRCQPIRAIVLTGLTMAKNFNPLGARINDPRLAQWSRSQFRSVRYEFRRTRLRHPSNRAPLTLRRCDIGLTNRSENTAKEAHS
jgi:hypothetical protein